ncbi:MAG: hypothetical protein ACOCRO_07805, partial [Halanaerobiales bacterium]
MVVVFQDIKNPYVFVVDTEYDKDQLLQFSGLLFEQIDKKKDIYQLSTSINAYIKSNSITSHIQDYTGIDFELLNKHGVKIKDLNSQLKEVFKDIQEKDVLLVGHNVKHDREIMKKNNLAFIPEHSYCTYNNAKKV